MHVPSPPDSWILAPLLELLNFLQSRSPSQKNGTKRGADCNQDPGSDFPNLQTEK